MEIKLFKPGLILFIISVIAGLALAAVFVVTEEPIAAAALAKQNEAMSMIIPTADTFNDVTEDYELTGSVYMVFEAVTSGETDGYIIGVSPKGYAGDVKTLVGFDEEGVIQNIQIVESQETAGLGALAKEEWFTNQYVGKTAPLEVVKGKTPETAGDTEISAITGSTITSNAVTSGVNEAADFFNNSVKGGN